MVSPLSTPEIWAGSQLRAAPDNTGGEQAALPDGRVAPRCWGLVELMPKQAALPPTLAPRLVGREAAAAYACVSPNTLDSLVERGVMPRPRLIPGTTRKAWDLRDLDAAIDALPHDGEDMGSPDEGWDD